MSASQQYTPQTFNSQPTNPKPVSVGAIVFGGLVVIAILVGTVIGLYYYFNNQEDDDDVGERPVIDEGSIVQNRWIRESCTTEDGETGTKYKCVDENYIHRPDGCNMRYNPNMCYVWINDERVNCCDETNTKHPGGFSHGNSVGGPYICTGKIPGADRNIKEDDDKCGSIKPASTCKCYIWRTSDWSAEGNRDVDDIPDGEWKYMTSTSSS